MKDVDCTPVPVLDMLAVDCCDFLEHLHILANIALFNNLHSDVVDHLDIYILVFLGENGEVLAHELAYWLFVCLKEVSLEGYISDLEEIVLFFNLVQLEGAPFEDQSDQRPLVMLELDLRVVLESLGIQRSALELHLAGLL